MTLPPIEVRDVSIRFPRTQFRARGIKEAILERGSGRVAGEEKDFWAVRDVSLEVKQGEVLGIIGANGSGKSTLLKAICGIYRPDKGTVLTRGRISALLELGAGFREELTAYENIFLNGAILGFSPEEMRRRVDQILEFSGLEQFVDQPLRTYSSGMKVRLAFAIASTIEPEILLIDEVLAVGDEEFGRKSMGRIESLASGHVTVLIVSHNLQIMKRLCQRLILMSKGQMLANGNPEAVVDKYYQLLGVSGVRANIEGVVRANALEIRNEGGTSTKDLPSGRPASFVLELEALDSVTEQLEVTFTLTLSEIFVTDAKFRGLGPMSKGDRVRLEYSLGSVDLIQNPYQLTAGVHSLDGARYYDLGVTPILFRVSSSPPEAGTRALWVTKGQWRRG
jgi:ABC-2 type transport system ATP-binding protein